MVRILEVDYSLERACGLIDMTIRIGGQQGGCFLGADNDDLALISCFLDEEIRRFESNPLDASSFEAGLTHLHCRSQTLSPLKSLKSLIDRAMAKGGREKQACLEALSSVADRIRCEVSQRSVLVDENYPGLRASIRGKPSCAGFVGPEAVLSAKQETRKKNPNRG
jgi:hypothetical protein